MTRRTKTVDNHAVDIKKLSSNKDAWGAGVGCGVHGVHFWKLKVLDVTQKQTTAHKKELKK